MIPTTAPPRLLVLRAVGRDGLLAGAPALRRAFRGDELVPAAPVGLAPVASATGAVGRPVPASGSGRRAMTALVARVRDGA